MGSGNDMDARELMWVQAALSRMQRLIVFLLAMMAMAGCITDAPEDAAPVDSTETEEPEGPHDDVEQTGYQGFDGEPDDCTRIVNPGPFDMSGSTVLGAETRILDVALATDASFRELYGDKWRETAQKVADAADAIYQEQLGLEVNVTAIIAIPAEALVAEENTGGGIDGEQSQKIIDDTKAYFNEHFDELHRDLVYTLVGNSTAGAIAGQVDCIGGAKFKDVAYGWGEGRNLEGPIVEVGPLGLGDATGLKVILHEMAHLLGAHHHYQTCGVHAAQSGPGDALGACSIMTNAVDFASFYFSEPNKLAIRGYADSVDL